MTYEIGCPSRAHYVVEHSLRYTFIPPAVSLQWGEGGGGTDLVWVSSEECFEGSTVKEFVSYHPQ
jgi:hypothetical protein